MERGFKHFAYLSLRGLDYVARQREAFQASVAKAGYDCAVRGVKVHDRFQSPDWNLKVENLAEWLKSLPKPVAILTWSGGREVIHACQQAGLRVPQEVALLSGSEDELLCECSPVPISGVQAACQKIGYEAADMLRRLMGGDQWDALPQWRHPERLAACVEFIVFARGDPPLPRVGYRMHALAGSHPAAATAIRAALAQGHITHPWLDPAVAEWIVSHGLYRE